MPDQYAGAPSSVQYILEEPLPLYEGYLLAFRKADDSSFSISVNGIEYRIPEGGEMLNAAIDVEVEMTLRSFTIESDHPSLFIENIAIINKEYDHPEISWLFTGSDISITAGQDDFPVYVNFYSGETAAEENVTVDLGEHNQYGIRTRRGSNPYWLYLPDGIQSSSVIKVSLDGAELTDIRTSSGTEQGAAIPLDLQELLYRDRSEWRQEAYELYRWNDFPSLLIMDTADYAVQSAFFKRLAFFTEKKISVGRLLLDEDLAPLHGWNAHDYKAADLARFFNKADQDGFFLNESERELKNILLENGVLKQSSGRVRPGEGGILSISRQSGERLRHLFLTHEGYHGIFFASDEYVSEIREIWNGLSEEERQFWRTFLGMYGYNVSDEYLLMNEFQAYLMQQRIESADSYFRGKINWILSLRPELALEMTRLLQNYGDTFARSARMVENSAYSLTGIRAGDLVLKRKK